VKSKRSDPFRFRSHHGLRHTLSCDTTRVDRKHLRLLIHPPTTNLVELIMLYLALTSFVEWVGLRRCKVRLVVFLLHALEDA
jgi:hypothetical protein